MCPLCVCVSCTHACSSTLVHVDGGQRTTLGEFDLFFSFYVGSPGDETRDIRLGGNHLHLLSRLAGPGIHVKI